MGRRKIEIRAIKDDRNRSVTFLKRKGGLFKKAHELSVLCSVDVAVIIFGHNKKLYEFSSGDINETLRRYQYYGPPHEHKGPNDFKNKGGTGGDDEEEEEEDEEASIQNDDASLPPQHPLMAQHLQQHNNFQHMRGPGSSASPPLPNGLFQPRTGTPGPSSIGSRPSSRNTIRRPSSNLMPMQHPHATPPQPQNGFAYTPGSSIYTPQPSVVVAPPHPSPTPSQFSQYTQSTHAHTPQPLHQPLPQNHQPYIPEPQHTPPIHQRHDSLQPPPQPMPRTSPQPPQQEFRQPEQATPPQVKALSSKSQSIWTPIDDSGSILAQQFFGAPDPPRRDPKTDSPPQIKAPGRNISTVPPSRPTPPPPPRTSKSSPFKPPTRSDTGGSKSGARPKLNLTIPSESSDNEESASPQARSALNSANPAREHHGIVLPPPSPSASAVLSAGASGPPNPFARPPPPTSNQNSNAFSENRNNNNNLETPISALPSRYMDRELLASPGGMFGSSWDNFNSNILPSPNIATPAEARIPGGAWGRVDPDNEKRKADEMIAGEGKRLKT